ncbi:MAG: tRNA (guanosine(37)-N1)-methyltransferase TrmD [Pseudobutyrivibrio sp.]|nr:tRNA (guanosine(37)-N1)-methyltransferase TrmD [Pseudobutyrivibrio sp.]
MKFYILTLFPEMIEGVLETSILGRAKNAGCISFEAINIRDFTLDKHNKVDDYPYGGGAGMVMQAQPIYDAYMHVCEKAGHHVKLIYLTPQGQLFSQPAAKELALEEDICLLCGHYEGIDERVLEEIVDEYYSIGDYVLTGGELPALVMVDAISRMVPGVLTNSESGEDESLENYLLEYPQYSRPSTWNNREVPAILLSGDHAKVDAWRLEQSILRTKERRPDLYAKYLELQG